MEMAAVFMKNQRSSHCSSATCEQASSASEDLTEDSQDEEDSDEGDEDGELALWSPDIHVLELQKEADRGLGFSILDYQVTFSVLLHPGGQLQVRLSHLVSLSQ